MKSKRAILLVVALLGVAGLVYFFNFMDKKPPPLAPLTNVVSKTKSAGTTGVKVIKASGPAVRYVTYPGSGNKVKIDGTATSKTWLVEGGVISGFLEINPADLFSGQQGKIDAKVETKIPVRSLKSGNGIMDERLQKEMKMADFAMINYTLTELLVVSGAAGGPMQCESTGNLAVSGVTNKIIMPVTISKTADDTLKVVCVIDLKMSSFGIPPPIFEIFGLGVLKTGDDVRISIEWIVKKK
jgi:hypothetical protein